jgi:tetratricopeptide (TPR) repeat protein
LPARIAPAVVVLMLSGCGTDRTGDPAAREAHRGYLEQARALYREGDLDAAVRQAARALVALPSEPESYELVSQLYVDLGDDETAIGFFELIARDHGELAEPWYYKGFHLFRLGRWEEALDSFGAAEAIAPDDPRIPFRQGLILQAMGEFDGALVKLRRAAELDPRDPVVAARLSRVLRVSGDYEEAERVVTVALAGSPDSADLQYALAQLRLREGRDGEAEEALRRAIALNPLRADAHHDLARLLARTDREDEGRRERLRADRLRDYADASGSLASAAMNRPGDSEPALALAELELAEGNTAAARRWWSRAGRLEGPTERVTGLEVELLVREGDLRGAESAAAKLSDSSGPRTSLSLAALDLAAGRTESGLRHLGQAVASAPPDRSFLRRAADLYERAGDGPAAEGLLVRASSVPWEAVLGVVPPGMRAEAP